MGEFIALKRALNFFMIYFLKKNLESFRPRKFRNTHLLRYVLLERDWIGKDSNR